jgi:UDP-N-acetylglucosamine diphosphorylase/glucosamine-1-phosphate N-acetyltransferase
MNGRIVLFEDEFADDLRPITLTRPAFAVSCAGYHLHQLAARAAPAVDWLVRPHLEKVTQRAFPRGGQGGAGPTLYLNASVAPDVRYVAEFDCMLKEARPCLCTCGQRVAAALVPAGEDGPANLVFDNVAAYLLNLRLPLRRDGAFRTFDYPFQVVGAQGDLFAANIGDRIERDDLREVQKGVFVGQEVLVPQTAVFHAEAGPVVLADGVRVLDFCYFAGPVYVGPGSRIIERSSVKEFTSIGHTCKVGGEVEASSIEPYTNKQHHGFLGHAYVGSWVNLGAGTSNSDLKNTYGEVRFEHRGRRLATGLQFLGCIVGDYAKSAINTSIFTGKSVGVASMLYGYVGQNVPSFCNYARSFGQVTEVSLEQATITQQRMLARRGVQQTEDDVALLRAVFELTRAERFMDTGPPVL